MRALCVYVDGGKGHYVPAKAVQESLVEKGHKAYLEEFFDYLDIRWMGVINKWWWRQMLKRTKLENKLSKHNDADSNGMQLAIKFAKRHCKYVLRSNLEENHVDFVFCTHPYASTILSAMFKYLNINIPVYYFATDVFNAPVASISNDINKFYISTPEGAERVKRMGQNEDTIKIVPFPLQKSVANSPRLSKKEARDRVGLDPSLFTIQLNLGGEGLGSIELVKTIMKQNLPIQIVVLGGIGKEMEKKLDKIAQNYPKTKTRLIVAGFVSNVNEFLLASDIIVGRAGINTIVEALYMHRPFLITELVYTVIPSADYVEKYKVGWNATNDLEKQFNIIKSYSDNPEKLGELEMNFNHLSISFGTDKFVEKILEDTNSI